MIRVTVDLVPFGREDLTQALGVIEIVNDGTGSAEIGHYTVTGPSGETYKLRKHYRRLGWKPLLARVFSWMAIEALREKVPG